MQRPREIWGRRSVAVGVVLVGLALIGGLVLLLAGGDDDDGGSEQSQQVRDLQEELLTKTVVDKSDGISVRRPKQWTDDKTQGVIVMRSPSRCVAVNLSAHDQKGIERLLSENVRLLRSSFKKVGVGPTVRDPVGGIPTISRWVDLTAEGTRRKVVLSIGKGKKHAYIIEVVVERTWRWLS
jgi:hypothetical protein